MGTMIATLCVDGDNTYKLDHIKKEQQRRAGTLPVSLTCPPELILKGQEYFDVAKNGGSALAVTPEALVGDDIEDTVDEAFLNQQQPEGTTTTTTLRNI